MTVKELITELLNMPMNANVELEVKTQPDHTYSGTEYIENVVMITDKRVLKSIVEVVI